MRPEAEEVVQAGFYGHSDVTRLGAWEEIKVSTHRVEYKD
jgi:hypothetical protein